MGPAVLKWRTIWPEELKGDSALLGMNDSQRLFYLIHTPYSHNIPTICGHQWLNNSSWLIGSTCDGLFRAVYVFSQFMTKVNSHLI